MNEEKRKKESLEEEDQTQNQSCRKGKSWRAKLALVCVCVVMMAASASATSGESSTGLAAVLAQSTNATSIIGFVFDLITGNAYLALLCFFGLVGAGVRLFRKGKRAAR